MKLLILLIVFIGSTAQAEFRYAARVASGVMTILPAPEENKYAEGELVGSYKYSQSFSLQGSIFSRFTDDDNYWGAQVTAPLTLYVPGAFLSSYIAPGYRYMNDGYGAPVMEGGINIHALGRIGVGYRFIFNEWVSNGLKTESQFFVTAYF